MTQTLAERVAGWSEEAPTAEIMDVPMLGNEADEVTQVDLPDRWDGLSDDEIKQICGSDK